MGHGLCEQRGPALRFLGGGDLWEGVGGGGSVPPWRSSHGLKTRGVAGWGTTPNKWVNNRAP